VTAACRSRAAVAAVLAFTFTAFYVAIARGVLTVGDDVLMFQVTESLLERGRVDVSAPLTDSSPVRPVQGADGARYAKYGIGLSLAALPFDAGGRWLERRGFRLPETRDSLGNLRTGTRVWAAHLTDAVLGGATVAVLFLLAAAAGYSTGVAAITAAALGGATVFAHSTTTFLSEPLSALTLTLALWAAVEAFAVERSARGGAPGWLALSGSAAGLAVATRASNLAPLAPLAVWVAWRCLRADAPARARLTRAAAWAAPLLAGAAAVAAYDLARFGSVFETGYGHEATEFAHPLLRGLAGLLVSPGRGLLWYAPPLVLALVGWRAFDRRSPALSRTAAAMAAALLVLAAKFYQWHGGGVWGPRLAVPVLPLLVLPAAATLARAAAGARALRLLAALCLAAGLFTVSLAVLVPFERAVHEAWSAPDALDSPALRASLWSPPASPLVVHARALPAAVPRTLRLLAGAEPMPGPLDKESPGLPDLAFARYGSHALLQVTRAALLAAVLATWLLARLIARPPRAA
jgi:hypothetical protein